MSPLRLAAVALVPALLEVVAEPAVALAVAARKHSVVPAAVPLAAVPLAVALVEAAELLEVVAEPVAVGYSAAADEPI